MRDAADLIVIGTPVEVKETAERSPLPNIAKISFRDGKDGKKSDVMGVGIETTFDVLAVLKGDAALKKFILHHYREVETASINGPGLVSFDPTQKKRYLMFLERETDGLYGAVSGQTDPYIAIREI